MLYLYIVGEGKGSDVQLKLYYDEIHNNKDRHRRYKYRKQMKTFKKIHEIKDIANKHILKIKKLGGKVRKTTKNGKIILEYSFTNRIASKFDLTYIENVSDKEKVFYDVFYKADKIGMVEFHKVKNDYIEIDRIYLEKNQQKKGYGQKIIFDILQHTKSKGFLLYPLDQVVWVKMGLSFIENEYPYMTISKIDFIKNNTNKLK